MTAATISIDRLLALILGLSYKPTVTVKRVRIVLIIFWLASFSGGFPYCIGLYIVAYGASFVVILLSIFASVFSFTKIALKLQQQQVRFEVNRGGNRLSLARYKKMVHSVALLQMTLIVCYMPLIFVLLSRIIQLFDETEFLYFSAVTVLFMNSSVNPILYCWRIGEVKKEVKNTLKQIFQRSSFQLNYNRSHFFSIFCSCKFITVKCGHHCLEFNVVLQTRLCDASCVLN